MDWSIQPYSSQPASQFTTCNPEQTFSHMRSLAQRLPKAVAELFVDVSVHLEQSRTSGLVVVVEVNNALVEDLNALILNSVLKIESYIKAAAYIIVSESVKADYNSIITLRTNNNLVISLLIYNKEGEYKIRDLYSRGTNNNQG